jgi:hypothetical protein
MEEAKGENNMATLDDLAKIIEPLSVEDLSVLFLELDAGIKKKQDNLVEITQNRDALMSDLQNAISNAQTVFDTIVRKIDLKVEPSVSPSPAIIIDPVERLVT